MTATPPAKSIRGIFIAGNWKMYKTLAEARTLAEEIAKGAPQFPDLTVAIFPAALAVEAAAAVVRASRSPIVVGAQNMHPEKEGAFTGEISAEMILSAGATSVILGHSERRHVFGESDEFIGKKVLRALQVGLTPVFCVGEKLDEREGGKTTAVVERQLLAGLAGVTDPAQLARVIVAYEPVWAIGTGKTATPAQGQEVHAFIRRFLRGAFVARGVPETQADAMLVLYGGSVKPENAGDILAQPDIDGLLVGGASLKSDSFVKICRSGYEGKRGKA